MVSFALNGKVALINGASRGIGEAAAILLAQQGAACVLTSRRIEGVAAVQEKIVARGGRAEAAVCHMGDLAQVRRICRDVAAAWGRLDILVNNAATNPYFGEMLGAPESAWEKTVAVNLRGPFFMIQSAAPLMARGGGGSIVNVASINGVSPAPLQGIYSITKAGVIAMTKAYAKELAPLNIRVNALLPGLTATKFSEALIRDPAIYSEALKRIPLRRHALPEEMAGAVLYLASEASSFTTGAAIVCDGGALA
jgi:NAD(P)-dependent dehydrogenase (short-subunit alcohol dehydrogenase family)